MVDLFCIIRFMAVEHFGCFQNGFPSNSCSLFCERLFATSRDETFSEQVYQKLLWQPVLVSTLEPYTFISFLRIFFFTSRLIKSERAIRLARFLSARGFCRRRPLSDWIHGCNGMTAAVPHSLCKSVETTVSVYVSKVRSLLAAQQNQVLNEGRVGVCVYAGWWECFSVQPEFRNVPEFEWFNVKKL